MSQFKPYPAYKESGVEWLGEVPDGWSVIPVKRDMSFLTSGSRGWASHYSEDGAAFIRIGNLTRNSICLDLSDLQRVVVPEGVEGERTKVCAGDVLFSITAYLGSVAVVPDGLEKSYVSQHVALLRLFGKKLLPRWVAYVTLSQAGQNYFASQGYGGTKVQLSLDDIAGLTVMAPSLSEQRKISHFLDHETARIDTLIEEQQRLIELLKEKRQAVISHAVTKGLVPTVPMKDSGVGWLGEVPAHWEIKQLKHVVDPSTSITYGIVQAGPEFEGGVPYIRTSDMSGEELPISGYPLTSPDIDESYARSRVCPGDIVMSIRASVGKCLPVPDELKVANLTQGTAKISAGKSIARNFLLAFLNSGSTQNYFDLMAKGATFKEITLDALRRTPVLLPPVNEQIDIDQFVAKHSGLLNETCKQAIQSVSLLQERRSALISAAVTGKIDVRGWQPPASAPSPVKEYEAV